MWPGPCSFIRSTNLKHKALSFQNLRTKKNLVHLETHPLWLTVIVLFVCFVVHWIALKFAPGDFSSRHGVFPRHILPSFTKLKTAQVVKSGVGCAARIKSSGILSCRFCTPTKDPPNPQTLWSKEGGNQDIEGIYRNRSCIGNTFLYQNAMSKVGVLPIHKIVFLFAFMRVRKLSIGYFFYENAK